ncbi:hypothetical protein ABIB82_004462 [Bradyrhizobium sp. i1.8.4]
MGPWTRDDAVTVLKIAPFSLGLGVLWAVVGLTSSGGGWLYAAIFFASALVEGPIQYLGGRYYDSRHPKE